MFDLFGFVQIAKENFGESMGQIVEADRGFVVGKSRF